VFQTITLRGVEGAIVWAYKPAVTLGSWSVKHDKTGPGPTRGFELRATIIGAVDSFSLRQRPLLFTAPRRGRNAGYFCFPVQQLRVNEQTLTATLGPPEY
jgi:hypothetical protein